MKITYTDSDEDRRRSQLVKGLVNYNDSSGPLENWEWMGFYAEDDAGNLLGGIHGNFEWDYLFIKHLWVLEQGKGLGSLLLQEAEKLAHHKNKKGVWLDTFEFQARIFYEKQGYVIFGTIPGAANEHTRYFLRKVF
jgi:GNAT superfamily N-acetyltransferase